MPIEPMLSELVQHCAICGLESTHGTDHVVPTLNDDTREMAASVSLGCISCDLHLCDLSFFDQVSIFWEESLFV